MVGRFGLGLVLLATACATYGEGDEDARRKAAESAEKDTPPASTPGAATPTASCLVEGWLGLTLANEVVARSACVTRCNELLVENPKARCLWGTEDITPIGQCVLTGGEGGKLVDGQKSRNACARQCEELKLTHPNMTCELDGEKIWL